MTNSISAARTGKGDMVWGILMLICGFLAIGILLASGIGVSIVYGAAGLAILLYPLAGLAWLTLVLATFLLIEAALEIALYFSIRRKVNAGWVLVDAIITL